MYLRVETQWDCYAPRSLHDCAGKLVVVSDNTSHSITCSKCSIGIYGTGSLPEFWMMKLINDGYVTQMGKHSATTDELHSFFKARRNRTPLELAGDVLEKFEVSVR